MTLPQGGEFAFLLFNLAVGALLISQDDANLLIVLVALSMALTPVLRILHERLLVALASGGDITEDEALELDGDDVLLIGYGRFGQIASQLLRTEGFRVTAVDNDPGRIKLAKQFGTKIYFGNATRIDVMRAAGAEKARIIALCINDRGDINKSITKIRARFPQAAIFCRTHDREHALELVGQDIDFQIRETFESSVAFGKAMLTELGVDPERVEDIETDFRLRDKERFALQEAGDIYAGMEKLLPENNQESGAKGPRR